MISIAQGLDDNSNPLNAKPDDVGIYEGASQWSITQTASGISAKMDFAAIPQALQGFDLAPSYGATFPATGQLCPTKDQLTQSIAYFWMRTDSQAGLAGSGFAGLADKQRATVFNMLRKGLPAGK